MNTIRKFVLGSAAGLAAVAGAQAADLPVKAKAVQYVKVCSLYGAGFYYIPGTDTCIRIGGHLRLDLAFNAGALYDSPAWQGGGTGLQSRARDFYLTRTRFTLQTDTRTATEYGVVRTYSDVKFEWANNRDNIAGGFVEVDYGFIQFAGFTFGKAVSNFDAPWVLSIPTINSWVIGGSHNTTGITQIAYTAQFGNGVSASLGLEDGRNYRRSGVVDANGVPLGAAVTNYGTSQSTFGGNAEAGTRMPDIVGNLRLTQGWGSIHVAGAVHEVTALNYSGAGTPGSAAIGQDQWGNPDSKFGFAVSAAVELKNLPTGAGDSLKVDATYTKGASKYVFGGSYDTAGSGRFGSVDGKNFGFATVLDGVFASAAGGGGSSIELTEVYGVRAFFEHYWNPQLRTSIWGGFAWVNYSDAASTYLRQNLSTTGAFAIAPGSSFDSTISQVGTTTSWQPVKDLTFSAEFTYARVDNKLVGTWTAPATTVGVGGNTYNFGAVNLYNGAFRVLRSF